MTYKVMKTKLLYKLFIIDCAMSRRYGSSSCRVVNIKEWPNGEREIPEFDQVHPCRDFTARPEWSTKHDQIIKKIVKGQLLTGSSDSTVWEG